MQYNALCIAKELGINRIVLASSVNSIGMGTSLSLRQVYWQQRNGLV